MIFLRLIWSYLKIGLFGFGGGYAMLALIENEIVTPGWITEQMFTDIVAISQMTPGPIGINSATYIGYVAVTNDPSGIFASPLWGIFGSIVCTLAVVIPPFLLVLYAGHFVARHHNSTAIRGIFAGLRPVTVGLVASAALLLMNSANYGTAQPEILKSIAISVAALAAVMFTKVHPIWVIMAAGVVGLIIF